ncbi:MAG: hypothetical protein KAW56_16665 [Candidatus Marinimicrobia bacterium]|nr:hypothetical protein [Candidatus Neomarinimicrobiota bacterium]
MKIFFLMLLLSIYIFANAQTIHLEDWNKYYLEYKIVSSKTLPKYVALQPYEFRFNISKNIKWESFIQKRIILLYGEPNTINIAMPFQGKIRTDSNRESWLWSLGLCCRNESVQLYNSTTVNEDYKYDPYFAGDLSVSSYWLFGRVNNAYFNYNSDNFSFFIGRMERNWGTLGDKSLILSNNPYTYDHLYINYKNKRFNLGLIFSQLDEGLFSDYKGNSIYAKRYLVGHRLDFMISQSFQLGFTEMAVYGGKNRGVDFLFFNPLTFYYPVQRNDRRQMNGLWSMDFFYKPISGLLLNGQFLIDDIIVNNTPGVNDRDLYPDRLGLQIYLKSADNFINGLETSLGYVRIWNRTYQSKYSWENFQYRGLGMGYPCASCEELKVKLAYWNLFPLWFQNEMIIGQYGNVSLSDVFPQNKEEFPVKPVIYNFVNNTKMRFFLNPSLSFFLNVLYFSDNRHYLNRYGYDEKLVFIIGGEYCFSGGFKLPKL